MPAVAEPETQTRLERAGGGGGKAIGTMAPKRPNPPMPPTANGYDDAPGWSAWLLVIVLLLLIIFAGFALWFKFSEKV